MTKLNKTQQALIARAKLYSGAASVEYGSGRGARGGRVRFGNREYAALSKLAEMGLARITRRDTDRDYDSGYCVHCISVRYELVANAL